MLDVKHWEMHIFEKKCMHLGKNISILIFYSKNMTNFDA